jgi:hypothetical protein
VKGEERREKSKGYRVKKDAGTKDKERRIQGEGERDEENQDSMYHWTCQHES